VVVVFALVGSGLLARSLYKIYNRKPLVSEIVEVSEELQNVRKDDALALENESGSEEEIAKRLIRFSAQNSEESRKMARKYINHKSSLVRAAAIEAIGGEDAPDVSGILKKALSSQDIQIRWAALRSLALRSDAERIELVESFLTAPRVSGEGQQVEELLALVTLYRLRTQEGPRTQVLNQIFATQLVRNFSFSNASVSKVLGLELQKILQQLLILVPDNNDIKSLALRLLQELGKNYSDDPDLQNAVNLTRLKCFQYLGAYSPEELASAIPNLSWSQDYTYQLAIIDFLVARCPKNRKQIESLIIQKPASPEIVQHLEAAQLTVKCGLGL
jgi:hypothetical protein